MYTTRTYDRRFEYMGQTEGDLEDALNLLWACEVGASLDGRQIIHGAKAYLRHVRLDALLTAKSHAEAVHFPEYSTLSLLTAKTRRPR